MKRFGGENLGERPNITILGSSKVGNFVITVPLLYGLRKKYPDAIIDFWGSEVTKDFEEELIRGTPSNEFQPTISWRASWDIVCENKLQYIADIAKTRPKPDLLINCDGFNPFTQTLSSLLNPLYVAGGALRPDGRDLLQWGDQEEQYILKENDWDSPEFLGRHKNILSSQYIAEILCRNAYLSTSYNDIVQIEIPRTIPNFKIPRILIHCTATRSAKIWNLDGWKEVIEWCLDQKISVGIIGAAVDIQNSLYNANNIEDELICHFNDIKDTSGNKLLIDLRGKTSLIELAGACERADAVISVDSGPLHIAAAVNTNVLAVVGNGVTGKGASPIRLWMPRSDNVSRTISKEDCNECEKRRYKNSSLCSGRSCMYEWDRASKCN